MSKRPTSLKSSSITVNNIEVCWNQNEGVVDFAGIPVAMMWVDSTLAHLMSGVQSMVGTERFALALQSEGRNSVNADWDVISASQDFEKGFQSIAGIAAVAGWGKWHLATVNTENKTAIFRAHNTWEGLYQKSLGVNWGSAMLAGKFAGYASKLFDQHCWSEQTSFIANGDDYDEFLVTPSKKTIESEIEYLLLSDKATRADMAVALNDLRKEVQSRKEAEAKINQLAFYDSLTQLPNRRYLQIQIDKEVARNSQLKKNIAVMFIDLDHFKTINDALGHAAGDQVLIKIAQRIQKLITPKDTLARIGGDEFILVLSQLNASLDQSKRDVAAVAKQIIGAIARPYQLNEAQYDLTASIGINMIESSAKHNDDFIKHSDIALYRAKQSGRNQFCFFDPEMQKEVDKQFQLRHELKKAILDDQFQVYFQPQFDDCNNIIGAEALVRWIHPEKGLVQANDFIPMAEEHRLIYPIGMLVAKKSLETLNQWMNSGLPDTFRHLSINVSAKQFGAKQFTQDMQDLIIDSKISPKLIFFEITESLLLENIDEAIEKINQFKDLGVRFSLDDFGTGFSSLSYLTKLPIDELKIDRSFINSLLEDNDNAIIVRTILSMADHLKLDVVAEGVEQESQLDFLKKCGCTGFQGYLMSKPVPSTELKLFGLFS